MTGHPTLNRRLVRQADRIRARDLMLVVLLSTVVLLPVLAYVWQNVEWIQIGYRIERLKSRHDRLVETQQRLRLEKATLESLARIEKVSLEQLGLSAPPDGMVVLMDRGSLDTPDEGETARIAAAAPPEAPVGPMDGREHGSHVQAD